MKPNGTLEVCKHAQVHINAHYMTIDMYAAYVDRVGGRGEGDVKERGWKAQCPPPRVITAL